MTELPPLARARIERALAAAELAVIEIQQEPPRFITLKAGFIYQGQNPAAPVQAAVLTALKAIVEVVTVLGWPASEQRDTVAVYQNQLLAQYGLDRRSFLKTLREQTWWSRFQRRLLGAAHTDTPSLREQLAALLLEARVSIAGLVQAMNETTTPALHQRTVERHLTGRPMQVASVRQYERAFSHLLDRPVALLLPPLPKRRRAGKKPVRRR